MTSATLFREGDDLDAVLASLDEEHPGRVRVVSVSYPREGGVFGFFARQRVAVTYEVEDADVAPASPPSRSRQVDDHPLAELIDAAEAAESGVGRRLMPSQVESASPRVDAVPSAGTPSRTNEEFAQMLLDLAARKSANRAAPAAPPAEADTPWETGRGQLALRRRLIEIGVPIEWVPADSADTYRVVEQLVTRLPVAPEPPTGAGDVLTIVGPRAAALRAAETLRARLRLRTENVWTAGCEADEVAADRVITDAWQAATVAAEVRLGGRGPTIVVVGLDDSDELGHEAWAAELVKALGPEALWVVVDATCKPSDTRTLLRAIGTATALIVTGAARTASPASVWELEAPVALLDGRPATRGAWATLLIDKLAALED